MRQYPCDELFGGLAVVTLAFADLEGERQSERIYDQVDLRRQATA
jgi:hypothetical protein